MSKCVLDASAVLAMVHLEPGADRIARAVADGAAISAVNLSEVVAKLSEGGIPDSDIHEALDPLGLEVIPLDAELAYQVGLLRIATRQAGLSLGDRSCLAIAQHLRLPALTTDRSWERLAIGITVQVIR